MTHAARIMPGHVLDVLRTLPDESAHCVVTSPPYWGLRDYGLPATTWGDGWSGCLGLEPTPAQYVEHMVEVFRDVRRVLRSDGTCWLNLGDTYAANRTYQVPDSKHIDVGNGKGSTVPPGMKPKDLVGIPWSVALALRSDGWWLRSDIIWSKPNPMPESVEDRPTKAHEYLFLLTKAERYYYDAGAIREPLAVANAQRTTAHYNTAERYGAGNGGNGGLDGLAARMRSGEHDSRNRRSVWTIATQPFPEAHFATFPPALVEPCILAGAPIGATVLDPFSGAGTTGLVALRLQRQYIGIELNPAYVEMSRRRILGDAPLLNRVTGVA